jgi:YrbI family 3-deoxy-D-manno-octulosonate 8-phosphate phosphatase
MLANLLHSARRLSDAISQERREQGQRDALIPRLKDIRFIIFDFDGVWTNNQVLVLDDGHEAVLCNRSDGLAISMARDAGLEVAVLTAELNAAPLRRCEKLRIECVQVAKHKLPALQEMLARRNLDPRHAAFVGNDINDIPCMQHVGVAIAVADAWPKVRAAAHAVTTRNGGYGAVREVIEWFLGGGGPAVPAGSSIP